MLLFHPWTGRSLVTSYMQAVPPLFESKPQFCDCMHRRYSAEKVILAVSRLGMMSETIRDTDK